VDLEARSRQLIDLIYEAALDRGRWADVVRELSAAFDDAATGIGITLPGDPSGGITELLGVDPEYSRNFVKHFVEGLPWASSFARQAGSFGMLGRHFPGLDFEQSDFYRQWMKPQHLAPCWPLGATILLEGIGYVGWLGIYRREGEPPFTEDDIEFGEDLFHHIVRAVRIQARLNGVERKQLALAEVMNRLPTGVVLLDAKRRVVAVNASAERIFAMQDGIALGSSGPYVTSPNENRAFQLLLSSALQPDEGRELEAGGFVAVSRPSGGRPYAVMVTPLFKALPGSAGGDAVVSVWIADPESGRVSATQVLEKLYQLTNAEAELVQLLSQGLSLEEAADKRGVTINTARSQLKQVFSKTDTRRQGELLRLVLTGVASIRDAD
jgi:DNA-binding CsgD family transcriptional regulator